RPLDRRCPRRWSGVLRYVGNMSWRRSSRLARQRTARVRSELSPLHPGADIPLCLLVRHARARLDHRAELPLGLNGRAIEVGQKRPLLLRVLHMAVFARDDFAAFAALESKHDDLRRARQPKVQSYWDDRRLSLL